MDKNQDPGYGMNITDPILRFPRVGVITGIPTEDVHICNNGRSNLASLVGELFKHLLYHRGQIPLNYNALLQVNTSILVPYFPLCDDYLLSE